MTLKELIEVYKGDIEVVCKEMIDDEPQEIVSFNVSEIDAIKDDITGRTVSKWYVESQNKIPVVAKLVVILATA